MNDSIENYISIESLKTGDFKILKSHAKNHEGAIYKKLFEMGYIYQKRNRFTKLSKYKNMVFTKSEIVNIFIDYLKTLDISKYNGKLTYNNIIDYFESQNAIRQNGLMAAYMK